LTRPSSITTNIAASCRTIENFFIDAAPWQHRFTATTATAVYCSANGVPIPKSVEGVVSSMPAEIGQAACRPSRSELKFQASRLIP
jgi:hypothetical protein